MTEVNKTKNVIIRVNNSTLRVVFFFRNNPVQECTQNFIN